MNHNFAEHVTGNSFALVLSKKAVSELQFMSDQIEKKGFEVFNGYGISYLGSNQRSYFVRRGLVTEREHGICELTTAGHLTIQLLREAGLIVAVDKSPYEYKEIV